MDQVAPYIKAVISDIKKYQQAQGIRLVPVGYHGITVNESSPVYLRDYLECGNDTASNIDFLNYNFDGVLEECSDNLYSMSTYNSLYATLKDPQIPQLYFSYCGGGPNGTFRDQDFFLGPDMNNDWSGSFVWVALILLFVKDADLLQGTSGGNLRENRAMARLWSSMNMMVLIRCWRLLVRLHRSRLFSMS